MGILGIDNRTENWKTARVFAPFFNDQDSRICLAKSLSGECPDGDCVKLELFWQGMRDQMEQEEWKKKSNEQKDEVRSRCIDLYYRHFNELRGDIEKFQKLGDFDDLQLPQDWNYRPDKVTQKIKFFDNLRNTEIDIVLETQNHLFIGEAKDESRLGANGNLILVHQLIRQYVMATILMHYVGRPKRIIPFVVADHTKVRNARQVKFMICHPKKWLLEKNVLSWDCVEKIANA